MSKYLSKLRLVILTFLVFFMGFTINPRSINAAVNSIDVDIIVNNSLVDTFTFYDDGEFNTYNIETYNISLNGGTNNGTMFELSLLSYDDETYDFSGYFIMLDDYLAKVTSNRNCFIDSDVELRFVDKVIAPPIDPPIDDPTFDAPLQTRDVEYNQYVETDESISLNFNVNPVIHAFSDESYLVLGNGDIDYYKSEFVMSNQYQDSGYLCTNSLLNGACIFVEGDSNSAILGNVNTHWEIKGSGTYFIPLSQFRNITCNATSEMLDDLGYTFMNSNFYVRDAEGYDYRLNYWRLQARDIENSTASIDLNNYNYDKYNFDLVFNVNGNVLSNDTKLDYVEYYHNGSVIVDNILDNYTYNIALNDEAVAGNVYFDNFKNCSFVSNINTDDTYETLYIYDNNFSFDIVIHLDHDTAIANRYDFFNYLEPNESFYFTLSKSLFNGIRLNGYYLVEVDNTNFITDIVNWIGTKLDNIKKAINNISGIDNSTDIDIDIDLGTDINDLLDNVRDNSSDIDLDENTDVNVNGVSDIVSGINGIFDEIFNNGFGIMIIIPLVIGIVGLIL